VITLRELELEPARLGRYRYVLVPDCPYLPRQAMQALKTYGQRRGLLVTAGRWGLFDEFGRPIAEDRRKAVRRVEIPDDGRAVAGSMRRDTHAGNTPPLFLWRKDAAGTRLALAKATASIRRVRDQAHIVPRVTLSVDDPNLCCVHWSGKDRQLVYLVNMDPEPAHANQLEWREAPAGEVRVLADLKAAACPATRGEGVLRVRLPRFGTCCLVEASKSARDVVPAGEPAAAEKATAARSSRLDAATDKHQAGNHVAWGPYEQLPPGHLPLPVDRVVLFRKP
jgi:hypothetical protein